MTFSCMKSLLHNYIAFPSLTENILLPFKYQENMFFQLEQLSADYTFINTQSMIFTHELIKQA